MNNLQVLMKLQLVGHCLKFYKNSKTNLLKVCEILNNLIGNNVIVINLLQHQRAQLIQTTTIDFRPSKHQIEAKDPHILLNQRQDIKQQ